MSWETKDTVTICIAVAAAIVAASSAGFSGWNAWVASDRFKRDQSSFLGFQLGQDVIAAGWSPYGDEPLVPTFSSEPLFEIINFGPSAAKNLTISFSLESTVPESMVIFTGPREPPLTRRKYRVGIGPREFFAVPAEDHTPTSSLLPLSRQDVVDPTDFLAPNKTKTVALPEGIRNEIAIYLLVEHLFRFGDVRLPAGQLPSLRPPVLTVTVDWQNLNNDKQTSNARWVVSKPRMEAEVENSRQFSAISNGLDNGGDPEWTGLKFGASLKRER
jgi:hypothetical protein